MHHSMHYLFSIKLILDRCDSAGLNVVEFLKAVNENRTIKKDSENSCQFQCRFNYQYIRPSLTRGVG